jgi:thiol-disulfide isomerase/thioredoxin
MTQLIIQRSLLSFVLFLAFVLSLKCWSAYKRWKVRSYSLKGRLPLTIETGKPVLLYFWTSSCSLCKPQERQIERAQTVLQQSGKTLNVQKLNALEEQALAQYLHVITVPTTVMLNSQGNVATWNPGLTQANTIIKQYLAIK